MRERLEKAFGRYLGPTIGLIVTLVLLSAFMWLWFRTGFQKKGPWTEAVGAFSSLAIALAALWAGQGLRMRQEEAAHARAELALNVELITRVIPGHGCIALEVEVRVKNISNKTWNLPVVYVFVHPVKPSSTASPADYPLAEEIVAPELWNLRGRNIARFSNTMVRLSPDEEEVFFGAHLIDSSVAARTPYFWVLVEAVGAPDSREFDENARDKFEDFLDGKLGNKNVRPEEAEIDPVRDTYLVIETTAKRLRGKKGGYGKRVLILPPGQERGNSQEERIDPLSKDFRGMLDKTMIWSRKKVVYVAGQGFSKRESEGALMKAHNPADQASS